MLNIEVTLAVLKWLTSILVNFVHKWNIHSIFFTLLVFRNKFMPEMDSRFDMPSNHAKVVVGLALANDSSKTTLVTLV